jgi:very-short-patch-repair endonuclease
MRSTRWTEEQLHEHIARRATVKIAEHAVKVAKAERRRESRLEAELRGNLEAMQLAPVLQFRFHPERKWRMDFAFPDVMVCVDVDGGIFAAENDQTAGKHARGAGIIKGFEKRNAAAELGYCVLCYGPPQVRSGEAALQIEKIVTARRARQPEPEP